MANQVGYMLQRIVQELGPESGLDQLELCIDFLSEQNFLLFLFQVKVFKQFDNDHQNGRCQRESYAIADGKKPPETYRQLLVRNLLGHHSEKMGDKPGNGKVERGQASHHYEKGQVFTGVNKTRKQQMDSNIYGDKTYRRKEQELKRPEISDAAKEILSGGWEQIDVKKISQEANPEYRMPGDFLELTDLKI